MGEEAHGHIPHLREVLVFLLATVIIVPIVHRLKASPVLGYLFVGAVIGPFGLKVISDPEGVSALAELGVVFLLFAIGLELSIERLRALRRYVFGLGLSQVVIAALVIGFIAAAWGNSAASAAVIGACLALSSTAMVLQLLNERGEIAARHGRVSFSILLFQDLAVVPILVIVVALGAAGDEPLWLLIGQSVLKAIGAVVVIILLGQFVLRRLLRTVAVTGIQEIITATTLLVILAIAVGTQMAGLSMALGAFLAGLMLAETEFRHQVETDIQPFKGLLLGLFFISVGMQLDFPLVAEQFAWIMASVAGLFVLKASMIFALARGFGVPSEPAMKTALLLGGAGEFAFVVIGAAMMNGVVSAEVGQFMQIVAGLSMVLTPVVMPLTVKILAGLGARAEPEPEDDSTETGDLTDHIVICGYGRVGQTVAEFLRDQKVAYVALDLDIARTRAARQNGEPVFYGDASRADVLAKMHLDRAAAVVITLDDPAAAPRAYTSIADGWPSLPVFIRARDAVHAEKLAELGAVHVVPETLESSLQLSGRLLHALGTPLDVVNQLIEKVRAERYQRISSLGDRHGDGDRG